MNVQDINPHFITDTSGNKVSVVLSMDEYKTIMDELEELEDIISYDKAKTEDLEFLDAALAFSEIENIRAQMKTNVQSSY